MPSSGVRTLHTHLFGPASPDVPHVLAVHGLTGHGGRWRRLADDHLPGVRVIAPDLLGHGHSPWEPPWRTEDHAEALGAVIDAHVPVAARPLVVLAHSYGAAVSLALAETRPDDVAGLVLLDPAQGLDPAFTRTIAESVVRDWGHADAEAAAAAKRMEGWNEVPADILDEEIRTHLIPDGDGGVTWRVSAPATATAWSEMTGRLRLPPPGIPTRIVVADRVDPPFVRPEFLAACTEQRAGTVEIRHVDTEHMVPFLAPALGADLVSELWTSGSRVPETRVSETRVSETRVSWRR